MSLHGSPVSLGLGIVVGLVVYAAVSYALLFYLPRAEDLPSGTVADAAFAVTIPFVLAVAWLAAVGKRL